ncbi:MAG: hypothetical protein U0793_33560 [Gemmataceae bacterium]
MSIRRTLLFGLLLASASSVVLDASAQPSLGPAPRPVLPPLLYLRIDGPKGMRVAFYPGSLKERTLETPALVGLRPGYCYRFVISDVTGFPNKKFAATIEAHASLILDTTLRNADFPATLLFADGDFRKTEAGVSIKKAILLERADNALPVASSKDAPLEITSPNRDLLRETRHLCSAPPLHMGDRKLTRGDGQRPRHAPLPGDKTLAPALSAVPPLGLLAHLRSGPAP